MSNLFNNQKGAAQLLPVLLIIAAVGIISFLLVTSIAPFKNNSIFSQFAKKLTHAEVSANTSYSMNVLVLKYFPLTSDGQNIDVTVTGDVSNPYLATKQKTDSIDNNLLTLLPKATTYLGYSDKNAQPSLTYQIVDTKEFTQAVPFDPTTRRPLYNQIMTNNNICDYVENKGVSEVWMWAYQGPNYPGTNVPYLNISESKMAGPFGDISNSLRLNDMPTCKKSYRVYTFNYGRGTAEAIHSWGHQIEAEMDAVDSNVFRNLWQGPNYPQTLGVNGRCGSIHNPPNARNEYDYANPSPQNSDCLNWNPDNVGPLTQISCQNWGCQDLSDSDNSQLNYIVWNLQNLPGRNNTKTYQGKPLRNWWDIHGNFDLVMASDRTLTLTPNPTPAPTFPAAHILDNFTRANNSTSLTQTSTGQDWNPVKGVWGIINNTAYSVTGCPAPAYAVINAGTPDGHLQVSLPVNHQDARIPFRYVDLNNYYWVENSGPIYEIDKLVNGTRTTLAKTSNVTPANGDVVDITLTGPSIQVGINNVLAMSVSDISLPGTMYGIGTWCDTSMRFGSFNFDYTPPPPPFGLQISPITVDATVSAGTSQQVLSLTSTGANQFTFFGYPTSFGPGINWNPGSGGISNGSSLPISIQVNSNIAGGNYTGTGVLKDDSGQQITFPVTVHVPFPATPTPTIAPTPTPVPVPADLVQGKTLDSVGPSATVTYNKKINSGDLLIAAVRIGDQSSNVTVTDNNGNTWTRIDRQNDNAQAPGDDLELWYSPNAAALPNSKPTITITSSAQGATIRAIIEEYTNILPSNSLDQHSTALGNSKLLTVTSGSVLQTNELVIGYGEDENGSTMTKDKNYIHDFSIPAGAGAKLSIEHQVTSSPGSQTATYTIKPQAWAAGIATFRSK